MCEKCKEYEGKVIHLEKWSPSENLKQSLKEMKLMREGKLPKLSLDDLWKVFEEKEVDKDE